MYAFVSGENMFVAQYYGKGDYKGISKIFSLVTKACGVVVVIFLIGTFFFPRQIMAVLTKTAIIAGILSGVVLIILSPFITRMVDLTPTARGYLQKMLLICSYYIAGKSVNCMTIGGIFAAGGDSKFGMMCDSITLWCITVPLGCICAFILKLPVMIVYFVLNLDEIIKLPVVYKHYKKYKWIKNLT